ncbi:MAG: TIGR03790 family protein [Methylacidiphilales bacterium]|nr:TIGR03790 family protein [Candidatus Methylacidiphilales bacterium]MDW8348689.1 TIGR03790 family protein [Verrucomicrobiae bacterium]
MRELLMPNFSFLALVYVILLFAINFTLLGKELSPAPLRNHLLVVYNRDFLGSEALARFYARSRKIPNERLLGIQAPLTETITREEFTQTILRPIENYLIEKGWLQRSVEMQPLGMLTPSLLNTHKNDIRAILLIRGIPLRIAEDPNLVEPYEGPDNLKHNGASVDSELAMLPTGSWRTYGPIRNPYFNEGTTPRSSRPFSRSDALGMVLVTRLDGPSNEIVRRRIQETLDVEKQGLRGNAFIDARGMTAESGGYLLGDEWLRNSIRFLKAAGFNVTIDDTPELFPDEMKWPSTAIYAGWYTDNAKGPMMNPGVLAAGSIAYHIHSYSAQTLHSSTQNWCGPLIHAGAAVTIGAVDEPYLHLMPHWDLFIARLLEGLTVAEAAYRSMPALSWKVVIVADPLYRPFAQINVGKLPDPIRILSKQKVIASPAPSREPSRPPQVSPMPEQPKNEELPLDPVLKPFKPVISKPAIE